MKLNKLKLLFALTLIVATTSLKAQELLAGISGGGATFGMNQTKEFNKVLIKLLPFTPVLKDNFPPWIFSKAEALYCLPQNLAFGLTLTSTSTGSRYTLSDYSGSYKFDNIQKGLFPGIKVLFGKSPGTSSGINAALEAGVAFSSMSIKENITISTENTSDSKDLKAMGIFIQPGVYYFQVINQKIRLSANLSYYFGIEKGYHLPGNKDQRLINTDTNNPVKPQWDGIRLGVTAYYILRKNSK
jgi:hypothetical protein